MQPPAPEIARQTPEEPATVYFRPEEVLAKHGADLTEEERQELLDYPRVYFWGKPGQRSPGDDESGNYVPVVGAHVLYRYEIMQTLGRGAFGVVVQAIDHADGKRVALKIGMSSKIHRRQGLMEITLQQRAAGKYIPPLLNSYIFRGHVVLVMEVYGLTLYDVIKANGFQRLPRLFIQTFAIQALRGLCQLQQAGVIHADIKPENYLFDKTLTLCYTADLGTGCFAGNAMYSYLGSRFYRAPELFMGYKPTPKADVWSFACVLAELCSGKPLFDGDDAQEVIEQMQQLLGPAPEAMLQCAPVQFPEAVGFGFGLDTIVSQPNQFDDQLLELLKGLLKWEPAERMTAAEALRLVESFGWRGQPVYQVEGIDLRFVGGGDFVDPEVIDLRQ